MNNFLHRLATRTLGTAPLAQPLVPATFAAGETGQQIHSLHSPWQAAETSAGQWQAGAPVTLAQQPDDPSARLRPKTADDDLVQVPAQVNIMTNDSDVTAAGLSVPAVTPPDPASPAFSRLLSIPFSRPPYAEPSLEQDAREPATELSRPAVPRANSIAVIAHRSDPFAQAAAIAGPATPQSRPKLFASPVPTQPVIKVTIGRVDVRAEFPAASSSPASKRRQVSGMSLDEYARQRSEGKR